MQQISRTLGSFLSAATIERVDIDGRAYKIISQVNVTIVYHRKVLISITSPQQMVPLFH